MFARLYTAINNELEVLLKSSTKVLEHGRAARKNDVLRLRRQLGRDVDSLVRVRTQRLTLYRPLRTSIGEACMVSSTTIGRGVRKSLE